MLSLSEFQFADVGDIAHSNCTVVSTINWIHNIDIILIQFGPKIRRFFVIKFGKIQLQRAFQIKT